MESPVLLRTCHICVKIFQNQKEYEEHRNLVHKKNQREICKHCGKTFSHKYYLNTHINLVHSQSPDQGKCNQCDETFENSAKENTRGRYDDNFEICFQVPLTYENICTQPRLRETRVKTLNLFLGLSLLTVLGKMLRLVEEDADFSRF